MNLDKKDEKHILKLLSSSIQDSSYEFEVLFKKGNQKGAIDKITFERLNCKLKYEKFTREDENPTLEIFLERDNIRISVIGLNNIIKYRKTNDINCIDNDCLVFMKKKIAFDKSGNKLGNLLLNDYNLKMKVKTENTIAPDNDYIQRLKDDWKSYRKTFRYKKRVSFIDDESLFSFDLSVIRNADKENEQFSYCKKIAESNVFKNHSEYEVELEFIGNKKKDISKYDEQYLYKKWLSHVIKVIQVIQKNSIISSNSHQEFLLNNYSQVVCKRNIDYQIRSKIDHKGHGGIGPKVVSLEMSNIFVQTEELLTKYYNGECIPSIRVDYSVTEKTDGDRQFLFISSEGKGYTIDNLMEFRDIGIHFPNFKNCIFDGEYVSQTKHKKNINHFLIFDCYFMNGEDVRQLPLYTPDKEIKLDSRLDNIRSFMKEFKRIDKKEPTRVKIFMKDYKFGDINKAGDTIFKKCHDIWKNIHKERYEYDIDGLIFTPIKLPVGGKYDKNDKFYSGRSWSQLFKWKPPEDNTIDFLVKIQQENGKDKIGYKNINGVIKKYKTLLLYVGNNTNNKNIDPYDLICEKRESSEHKGFYTSQEFVPCEPMDPEAYIANIYTDNINNRDEMVPLKGGIIKDDMIVEMSYNKDLEKNWRWIPRNIRYDKTAVRLAGGSEFGNNYNTAANIWSSYYNPITEEMIFKGINIPANPMDNSKIYYHLENNKRVESPLRTLRDFHTLYVKDKLYECTSNMFKNPALLELGCGKGGDMSRWIKHDFKTVVGVDLFNDNIENKQNGAIKRYLESKKKYNDLTKIYYLAGDCGKNIKSGSFTSGFYENIYKILWNGDKSVNLNRNIDNSCLGICKGGFDVISCQFAMHYFFKNSQTLEDFIKNLVENIKDGGFFIGTCLDGKTVFERLETLKKEEILDYKIDEIPVWSIKKKYENSSLKNDESSLGVEIDVYLVSIGEAQTEYLVNFDYFQTIMMRYGFELMDLDVCSNFCLPCGESNQSSGMFDKMFKNMFLELNNNNAKMSKFGSAVNLGNQPDIQEYSFFNRWFIFRKTGSEMKTKKIKVKK